MTWRRIIVGIDFSDTARRALEHAEALGRHHGAEIILVHGTGITDAGMYVHEATSQTSWKLHVRQRLERARSQMTAAAETLRQGGLSVSTTDVPASGHVAIVGQAEERSADLVVVGTHGRSGFDRFLMGSVAERVVRRAPTNVLVARGRHIWPARRLLVPIDFSPAANHAVEVALLNAHPGAQIVLLHCWVVGDFAEEALRSGVAQHARQQGEALVERHRRAGLELSFELLESPAAAGILKRLDDNSFDAVVMGNRGLGAIKRIVLGSVAEQVVRYASLPVMIAHA